MFKPGQSGNPNGRPKVVGEIRDLARKHTAEALGALVDVLRSKKAPHAAKVAAASQLLDRGYGKPTQHIDANIGFIDRLSEEQQDDLLTAIQVFRAGLGADRSGTEATTH